LSSYAEMKKQIAELEKQAAKQRKAEIKDALLAIRALMKKHRITAADLGFYQLSDKKEGPRKKKKALSKSKLPAKYRDPATGATWSGHGRAPGWILLARAAKTIDALLIDKPAAPKKAAEAVKAVPSAKKAPATTKKSAVKAKAKSKASS
jgi:DNA-binding protein H-NS